MGSTAPCQTVGVPSIGNSVSVLIADVRLRYIRTSYGVEETPASWLSWNTDNKVGEKMHLGPNRMVMSLHASVALRFPKYLTYVGSTARSKRADPA